MIVGLDTTFLVQHDVREAPHHSWARRFLRESVLERGYAVGLAPQVLAEYIHIVSDQKRFESPLSMERALERAAVWWGLVEAHKILPDEDTVALFFEWMGQLRLGRKRILDTFLAATYTSHGIRSILSTDLEGFRGFSGVEVLHP